MDTLNFLKCANTAMSLLPRLSHFNHTDFLMAPW